MLASFRGKADQLQPSGECVAGFSFTFGCVVLVVATVCYSISNSKYLEVIVKERVTVIVIDIGRTTGIASINSDTSSYIRGSWASVCLQRPLLFCHN